MLLLSPQTTYDYLGDLDRDHNDSRNAFYRQLALEVLADTGISLDWRQMIADRLNEANNLLGMVEVGDNDDSY
jgi:hypothetical protein